MTESLSGETKPLLAKHVSQFPPTHDQQQHRHPNQQFYNAAPQHIPLKLTGRGKLRFTMRQQLPIKRRREKAQGTSQHAVFNALFAAQKIRHHKDMNPPIESARGESKSQNKNVLIPQNSFEQSNKQSAILPAVEEKLDSPLDFDKGRPKHSQLYHTLNSKSRSAPARLFQKFITSIILIDSIVYILSTEPKFSNSSFFYIFEGLTSIIFLIEYISRLVVCTEKKSYGKYGPIRGRLKYLWSSQALFDGFATLPFFVEFFTGLPLPTLTYLRIFRLMRITRTASYSRAMDAVWRVLYFNREILYVAGLLGMYLVLMTSILMYYLRPRGDDVYYIDDPKDFSSIASTMVLSLLMLTGQGGPSGKLPWYTQLAVLLTGIFSVAMFAIPASMLTWGFEAEAERLGIKAKKRAIAMRRGEVCVSETSESSSESDSLSCFGDISTSDEEYMNIIGGDDEDLVVQSSGDEILKCLQGRIDQLEQTVAETNNKLDLILERLGGMLCGSK